MNRVHQISFLPFYSAHADRPPTRFRDLSWSQSWLRLEPPQSPGLPAGAFCRGRQPREGATAHTALGRWGSVRAYGGEKPICECANRPVGPGGRCEVRLVPATPRSALAHLPGFQTPWGHGLLVTRLPFPLHSRGGELLCRSRGKCGGLCPLCPWLWGKGP